MISRCMICGAVAEIVTVQGVIIERQGQTHTYAPPYRGIEPVDHVVGFKPVRRVVCRCTGFAPEGRHP